MRQASPSIIRVVRQACRNMACMMDQDEIQEEIRIAQDQGDEVRENAWLDILSEMKQGTW